MIRSWLVQNCRRGMYHFLRLPQLMGVKKNSLTLLFGNPFAAVAVCSRLMQNCKSGKCHFLRLPQQRAVFAVADPAGWRPPCCRSGTFLAHTSEYNTFLDCWWEGVKMPGWGTLVLMGESELSSDLPRHTLALNSYNAGAAPLQRLINNSCTGVLL